VTPTGDARAGEARAAARRVPAAVRLFAVGFGLAGGASATAMTFLVPSAVAAGMQPAVAGTVLAVASVGSILARLVAGWGADRVGAVVSRGLVAAMVVGAAGAAIMTVGVAGWPILLAGVLLLTGGSGWTGLGFTAVVRAAPDLPATAAAVALTGLAIGGTAGPLLFGVVVSRTGYPAGWALLVGAFAVGAAVVAVALRRPVGGTTRSPTGTRS
jgi:MFS family permease